MIVMIVTVVNCRPTTWGDLHSLVNTVMSGRGLLIEDICRYSVEGGQISDQKGEVDLASST